MSGTYFLVIVGQDDTPLFELEFGAKADRVSKWFFE